MLDLWSMFFGDGSCWACYDLQREGAVMGLRGCGVQRMEGEERRRRKEQGGVIYSQSEQQREQTVQASESLIRFTRKSYSKRAIMSRKGVPLPWRIFPTSFRVFLLLHNHTAAKVSP